MSRNSVSTDDEFGTASRNERERRCAIEQFNATQANYPHDKLIHGLFEEQVERTPDAVAVVHERQSLTYAELNVRANRLARYLIEKGAGPDRLVAICVERSLEMVVGLLAILKSGGAYVPLDPNYPFERLSYMLQDAAPWAVLTQSGLRKALPDTQAKIVELDINLEELVANSAENVSADELGLTSKNLLYAIYTSGSTGRPKGTAMPHRSMANLIEWHRHSLPTRREQRVLQTAALSFDVAFQETFSTLCAGGTLVLLDEWVRRDASALLELVRAEAIERLFVPPLMLQAMAESFKSTGIAPRSLKDIIAAGEQLRISSDIVDFFNALDGCRLHNHYGPTETHVATALTLAGRAEEWPALPPIGRPLANMQIHVLDSDRQPMPIGVAGEIHIGGANLARGYLNQPELTAQRFIENPFSAEPRSYLYRTGDLGRWQADGTLEYLGRNDDQVKIRGYRIELGEIETRLARHPRVAEVAVVAREDSPGDKRLVAYITTRNESSPSPEALRAFLNGELPEYMVPAIYVKLDRLPLTPNGKLDRASLRAPDSRACEQTAYAAPEGEVEIALAAIWKEVLKVDRVGREDNFFELGGDSLLIMRAASRIRHRWNTEFSVRELFRHSSLRALADSIAHTKGAPLPPLLTADRGAPLPLSFAQQGLWFLCQMRGVSASYNITTGLHLKGKLDAAALQAALNRIVERHEALRTTFAPREGGVVQVVSSPKTGWKVTTHDLGHHPDAERELRRMASREANDPFDLEQGPLCRGRLILLADDEHALLLTVHHLVSDGWSMAVLFSELSALYDAFRRGTADSLPAPRVQYADYAIWQRGWLVGERLERQAEYWKQTLEAAPALLELPTDHPRPPAQTHCGDDFDVSLDSGLTRQLRALGRRHGATLFVTLMTGWTATLSRLSGQKDLVIGTPTANRTRTETEEVIGFFVNTLALRMDLSGSPTVAELLRRVKEQMLAAQSHSDIVFEQVVEVVRPVRSTGHSPIFQALMAWQNMPPTSMKLTGLQLVPMTIRYELSKFDLSLSLAELGAGVAGTITFATSLFERETVSRFIECWKSVLQAMVDDDQQQIDRLPCPLTEPVRFRASAGTRDLNAVPAAPGAGEFRQLAYETPKGEMEVALAEIWKQILGLPRVGRHDNFFGLGGTSLQLLLVMNRIMETLHVTLSLEALYSSVSLTDLARNVLDSRRNQLESESGVI